MESVYRNTPFDSREKAVLLVPVLISTSDPQADQIIIVNPHEKTVFHSEEIRKAVTDRAAAGRLMNALKEAESYTIHGRFQKYGTYLFQADCTGDAPVITVDTASRKVADDLLHDLFQAASSLFPDAFANDEEMALSINYQKEAMTLRKMFILNHDTREKDFLSSRLYGYVFNDGMGPHIYTIGMPLFYAGRDWVMRLSFNHDGSLKAVSLRLIVARNDGTAVYEDLTDDEMAEGFDQLKALLDRESGFQEGSTKKQEDLSLYGYARHNVMAVKDLHNHCVSLDMLFTVRQDG